MRLSAVFGWLIVLVGAGQVALGALYLLDGAFSVGVTLAVLGLAVLVAAASLLSLTRGEQGLGVIY